MGMQASNMSASPPIHMIAPRPLRVEGSLNGNATTGSLAGAQVASVAAGVQAATRHGVVVVDRDPVAVHAAIANYEGNSGQGADPSADEMGSASGGESGRRHQIS